MRKVTGMEIIFENCERSDKLTVGDMRESDIYVMAMSDIKRSIVSYACNAVIELFMAENIEVRLNRSANRNTYLVVETEATLFQRILECPDITQFHMYYDDGTEDDISVPWEDRSEYKNEWQTSRLDDEGRLVIKIRGNN